MAKNVVREFGTPQNATCKNIASAKLSGDMIVFPPTAGALNPVALLLKDAASGEDGIPCMLGNCVVRYAALSTDTADPGTPFYFDVSNNRLTTTAATHNWAGRAAKTKINGDTTADVYLNMKEAVGVLRRPPEIQRRLHQSACTGRAARVPAQWHAHVDADLGPG